jgi:hypothetical protein
VLTVAELGKPLLGNAFPHPGGDRRYDDVRTTRRTTAVTASVATLAMVLAACGSEGGDTAADDETPNREAG